MRVTDKRGVHIKNVTVWFESLEAIRSLPPEVHDFLMLYMLGSHPDDRRHGIVMRPMKAVEFLAMVETEAP